MKRRRYSLQNYKMLAIEFSIIAVVMVALATGVYFIPTDKDYSHYDAAGVIASFTAHTRARGSDWFEFTLENDDNVYYLDNIAQANFHGKEKDVMTVGSTVSLSVANIDSRGRLRISRFEKDGITYLSIEDFERAHKSNYIAKDAIMYVFYGLGAMCLGIAIYNAVMTAKRKLSTT